jgi:hypothetical protein
MKVGGIQRETKSVISISLEDPDGGPLAPARPGQYLTLRLQPDIQARSLLRNYSLSGQPGAEIVPPPPISASIGAVKRHGHNVSVTVRISPNHATVTATASRRGCRRVLLRSAQTAPGTTVFTATLHPGRWTITVHIHAEPGYTARKPVTRTVQIPSSRHRPTE